VIIKMIHIRKAKMCSKGTRSFFLRHNIDWSSFIKNGVDEDILLSTGDAMAKHVVEVANGR
jgi:hypothetical protein